MKYFVLLFVCAGFAFADNVDTSQRATYISPNNDGVKDNLKLNFAIRDKSYITEWHLYILNSSGNVVKTVSNKENRTSLTDAKSLLKAIATPKSSVVVPPEIIWNGTFENGSPAPDGTYTYYIMSRDNNGNTSETERRTVIVDNTPPTIVLTQPSIADKFFGEGSKSVLRINESGSKEDLWTATIWDTSGNVVRTFRLENSAPTPIAWDGHSDSGDFCTDGVYTYSIEAQDRAGNRSEPARVTNIIYSREKPVTGIAINGSRYASPKTESKQQAITLVPAVPAPTSGNTLQSWKVEIVNAKSAVQKTFYGGSDVPQSIMFDGTDEKNNVLPDGQYQARLIAAYQNGYETPARLSPVFILKTQKPTAIITIKDDVFSPDGNGDKDTITLSQKISAEESAWQGQILDAYGNIAQTVVLGGKPGAEYVWNGLNSSGGLCPDGKYTYRVTCTDPAGNMGTYTSAAFTLDTSKAELVLSVFPDAFSPNNDGSQDKIRFMPIAKAASGIANYSIEVVDSSNRIVWTNTANTVPQQIEWDGSKTIGGIASDGTYFARLTVSANSGTPTKVESQKFVIDTVAPSAEITADYLWFSPEDDSLKKNVPFKIKSSREKQWSGTITKDGGTTVRNYTWFDSDVKSFAWTAEDNSGNISADGKYTLALTSTDAAGNKGSAVLRDITVDSRAARAWLTTLHETIAPNGKTKEQIFTASTSIKGGIDSWSFSIVNTENSKEKPLKTMSGKGDTMPSAFAWDGKRENGAIAEGIFTGIIELVYLKGSRTDTESPAFVCTGFAPKIAAKISPQYFSPDNDGVDDECNIQLIKESLLPIESWSFEVFDTTDPSQTIKTGANIPFWTVKGGQQITDTLVWDGKSSTRTSAAGERQAQQELVQSAMDYPFRFTVTDIEGQTSQAQGMIGVDILVILLPDGRLKMQVPSIVFPSDRSEFISKKDDPQRGLDQSIIDNNNRWLKRIAQVLNKFKDYTVVIEGHANSITGGEAEETTNGSWGLAAKPLSKNRAEFVKRALVKNGVAAARLETDGKGGTEPVADRSDQNTRWKNRRVEFILNK
ncbi:MAG: hypothetical protein Ta2B_01690 [Termitinemataceae bacterium]|nr:MAG: hypothetical protein Ta2B_01690 [Termitinemataceae bacterium]